MSTSTAVSEARDRVLALVPSDRHAEVRDLFDDLRETFEAQEEGREDARAEGYREGFRDGGKGLLAKALREFAIWQRDRYESRVPSKSAIRDLVGQQLWSRVINEAGPEARLPSDPPGVHPQALRPGAGRESCS